MLMFRRTLCGLASLREIFFRLRQKEAASGRSPLPAIARCQPKTCGGTVTVHILPGSRAGRRHRCVPASQAMSALEVVVLESPRLSPW
jgi:hypothetical protein